MDDQRRVILCMKWGTKYGPEYVNRLYAMVRRHLRGEFKFVCLTDRSDGIRAEVTCLPIPPLALPPGSPERGWTKLTTFEADLHGLTGTALFLDLDVVIVDDITPFFEEERRAGQAVQIGFEGGQLGPAALRAAGRQGQRRDRQALNLGADAAICAVTSSSSA